ncbi:hypothetical protein XPA_004816 [Xanthoria parietina]
MNTIPRRVVVVVVTRFEVGTWLFLTVFRLGAWRWCVSTTRMAGVVAEECRDLLAGRESEMHMFWSLDERL